MQNGIHFISGLPRSGSTLLAALLLQNPALHAGIISPVGSLVGAMLREVSQGNETAVMINDGQRQALLRGVFESYYHAIHPSHTVFDTNRVWCIRLHLIAALFPEAKIICCVRHLPWVLDSIERLIRENRWELVFPYRRAHQPQRDGGVRLQRAETSHAQRGIRSNTPVIL